MMMTEKYYFILGLFLGTLLTFLLIMLSIEVLIYIIGNSFHVDNLAYNITVTIPINQTELVNQLRAP